MNQQYNSATRPGDLFEVRNDILDSVISPEGNQNLPGYFPCSVRAQPRTAISQFPVLGLTDGVSAAAVHLVSAAVGCKRGSHSSQSIPIVWSRKIVASPVDRLVMPRAGS